MPKEKKKRGRRDNVKKRKAEDQDPENSNKRRRPSNEDEPAEEVPAEEPVQHEEVQENATEGAYPHPGDMPFYGLLDEEEAEYFRRADEMLELNHFTSPEDREVFLSSVYKEAEGKELKMANSQSCSRLMERLIQLSSTAQLKSLFLKFADHFLHLFQHRFASHCCEALFIQAAPVVTIEMKTPPVPSPDDPNEVYVTMEDLFLRTIKELDGYLGYLMMDKFASHTLRVLLAVLSGQPLARTGASSVLHSKNKEFVSLGAGKGQMQSLEKRVVPESFKEALQNFVSQSVSGFDTGFLQSLSHHPTGNPTLQLLIQLELTTFGKQKAKDENSIIHKLLPDDPITEESDSGKFINSSMYDALGSRLLETILTYSPGKSFKAIYKTFIKERVATLARNDVASYIVVAVLTRIGKDDLADASKLLVDQMPMLVERNRTVVIRTLVERCSIRGVNPAPIADALARAYGGPNGFDITQMLKLSHSSPKARIVDPMSGKEGKAQFASEKLHGSLLAQAMIAVPGELGNLIYDGLARLGTLLVLQVARDVNASRVVQAALTAKDASVIARRKIIQLFYGHVGEMALDPSASHVIDAIWKGTSGLAFIRERVAEELAENEAALRESHVGRAVWRNWKMDLYKRRRSDWVRESRVEAGSDGFLPFPEEGTGDEDSELGKGKGKENKEGKHLTAIEKARMKHALQKGHRNKKREREEDVEEEAEGEQDGDGERKKRKSVLGGATGSE